MEPGFLDSFEAALERVFHGASPATARSSKESGRNWGIRIYAPALLNEGDAAVWYLLLQWCITQGKALDIINEEVPLYNPCQQDYEALFLGEQGEGGRTGLAFAESLLSLALANNYEFFTSLPENERVRGVLASLARLATAWYSVESNGVTESRRVVEFAQSERMPLCPCSLGLLACTRVEKNEGAQQEASSEGVAQAHAP